MTQCSKRASCGGRRRWGTRGAVRLWTIRVYACTSWDYMHDREVDTFF
jgi:hypothetical protein